MVWNEAQSLQLMLQLLELVEFMHGRDRVHRHISLSNVLLHEGDVQLIDFGLTWHRSEPSELVLHPDTCLLFAPFAAS
ncbi:protein kinase domain-containing protein [Paenibacillus campi]|uniref:protein kinase domain-containing protein n=1 Tax=Paenibacillus campi TaxID=3106031 RepID=UPI002AFF184E|nr:protein kinase [Paenibacillus sp. SGZ-1014]